MGLLSVLSPWARLGQRPPQQGVVNPNTVDPYAQAHEGWQATGKLPGPMPPPQQGGGFDVQGIFDNPLLQAGLSIMGNARNGGDWAQVGRDIQEQSQARFQRQALENEMRRQKAGDARDEEQFGWNRDEALRASERYRAFEDAVNAEIDPLRRREMLAYGPDAWAERNERIEGREWDAQQAEIQRGWLEREAARDRAVSRNAMALANPWQPRGTDAVVMNRLQAGGESATEGLFLLDRFQGLLDSGIETGGWGDLIPRQLHSPGWNNMVQIESILQTMFAPQAQGAVSNLERELFAEAIPSVRYNREDNARRIETAQMLLELRAARAAFFSQYGAERRTTNGAEAAFQASPEFQQITSEYLAQYPRGGGSGGGNSRGRGGGNLPSPDRMSDEEIRRELGQ